MASRRTLSNLGLFLVFTFLAYLHLNKKPLDTQSLNTKIQLTPNEFISLLDAENQKQAEKYIDQAIEIQGTIEKVTFRNNKYALFIKSGEKGRFILCEMQADQTERVREMKNNENVTVKGIFKGILLDAILLNCIVINEAI